MKTPLKILLLFFLSLYLGVAVPGQANATLGASLGLAAPKLVGKTLKGKLVDLSHFRGKFVMVTFWASWCPACREELPNIIGLYNNRPDNLEIITVATDKKDNEQGLKDEVKKHKIPFPVIWEASAEKSPLAVNWGVTGTPTSFLINPDGVIVAKGFSGAEGADLVQSIVTSYPEYLPPKFSAEYSLDLKANSINVKLFLPDLPAGTYDFELYMESHGSFEEEIEENAKFSVMVINDERLKGSRTELLIDKQSLRNSDKFSFNMKRGKTDDSVITISYTPKIPVPTTFIGLSYYDKLLTRVMTIETGFVISPYMKH